MINNEHIISILTNAIGSFIGGVLLLMAPSLVGRFRDRQKSRESHADPSPVSISNQVANNYERRLVDDIPALIAWIIMIAILLRILFG